jgi:hypothetical protein
MVTNEDEAQPISVPHEPGDDPVIAPSTSGSFEEPRSLEQRRPTGGGWRHLSAPVTVRAYIAEIWVDAKAIDVNDNTREIRVEWPPPTEDDLTIHHMILDASHYKPMPGLFD